ncbi:MAG: type II toxin-antitoxin system prevent-host-death family antitoxin [Nitrospinota bacterium]|nr:MAG: type II toxin-antitoxin system prevent-host-death family antitoxin [Nitrospinota bacterium]
MVEWNYNVRVSTYVEEHMLETTVSIRELKSRLNHYLRLAKAGQTIEITERGRPIGRIVPVEKPLEDRLEAMAILGYLVRAQGKLEPRPPVARLQGRKTVAEILVENRE